MKNAHDERDAVSSVDGALSGRAEGEGQDAIFARNTQLP